MQRIGFVKDIFNEIWKLYNEGQFKKDKKYLVEINEYKGSKTEEQLKMYNATLREIQKVMFPYTGQTRDRLHNAFLNDLGILETKDGEPIVIKISADYDYMKDSEFHLKSIRTFIDTDGKEKRECYVLKESKNFTTEQFSQLIDALVQFVEDNELQDKIDTRYLQNLVKKGKEIGGKQC